MYEVFNAETENKIRNLMENNLPEYLMPSFP
jgi:hypothetical protein